MHFAGDSGTEPSGKKAAKLHQRLLAATKHQAIEGLGGRLADQRIHRVPGMGTNVLFVAALNTSIAPAALSPGARRWRPGAAALTVLTGHVVLKLLDLLDLLQEDAEQTGTFVVQQHDHRGLKLVERGKQRAQVRSTLPEGLGPHAHG